MKHSRAKGFVASIWGDYKILFLVVLLLSVAWLLYPTPQSRAKSAGQTELTFWLPTQQIDWVRPAVEEFERRNKDIKVILGSATARNVTGDPTRFLLGVAGGMPPDLIFFDRFAIVEWASRNAFTDLTPYIQRDKDEEDGIHKSDYYTPAWEEPIYKGRTYAVANTIDTRALYYNRDSLIRAGYTYKDSDQAVEDGKARAGDGKPPVAWEEVCLKKLHVDAVADGKGVVRIKEFVRRSAVNEGLHESVQPLLSEAGIRPGDVASLVKGEEVFRGRIKQLEDDKTFVFDLVKDQKSGLESLPSSVVGDCELKIFDKDSYVCRLTKINPKNGRLSTVAMIPMFGNSWLYMYGWLNNGEFMSKDGTTCTLDEPRIVAALQWIVDVYDAMGGVDEVNRFQVSTTSTGLHPFFAGTIAMIIDGNWFLQSISQLKPNMNFGVVPAPQPAERIRAGAPPIGWGGGWAYAIPATAKAKEGSWRLMKWLSSPMAIKIATEFEVSQRRSKGQNYFPQLHPNKKIMAWLKEEYVEKNPTVTPNMHEAFGVFTALLPYSKYRPVTPVGQKLWREHARAAETAIMHSKRPYEALNYGKRQVQSSLEQMLNPPTGPEINWHALIIGYVLLLAATIFSAAYSQRRKKEYAQSYTRRWRDGFICASPWFVGFVVFGVGPIIFSIIISFSHYDVLNPARFIGFGNYTDLIGTHFDSVVNHTVANDPLFWKSLKNTLFMVIGVPVGIVAGLLLALLLNARLKGLRLYRTIYYLPVVVPAVASFILWIWIFEPNVGMLTQIFSTFGLTDLPNWLGDPAWAKPSLILMGLWGAGGSMFIWLTGLKDIPESYYEAASVDGAGRLRCFFSITLPLLTPYIFFNMIMGFIGVFQIFEISFIMTDGGPADATLFYAYKLFNEAFRYLNMGKASAMAWILFIIVLGITVVQLWLSKKWVHYRGE